MKCSLSLTGIELGGNHVHLDSTVHFRQIHGSHIAQPKVRVLLQLLPLLFAKLEERVDDRLLQTNRTISSAAGSY